MQFMHPEPFVMRLLLFPWLASVDQDWTETIEQQLHFKDGQEGS